MTPTRWLIAAFWVVVLAMCAKSFYDYNSRLDRDEAAQGEKHWYPPPLPGAPVAPPQAQGADVRQVAYTPKENPQAATFTADLTIKNFGLRRATDIQVRVQPYVGTTDSPKQPGPDEIQNSTAVDQMATVYQWVEFPDLDPGQTETKTLSFPVRTDAEPRQSFPSKVSFDTAKDKP